MTPLQLRRLLVGGAIAAHVETVGPHHWAQVQALFPDLPPATFWRYVRQCGEGTLGADPDAVNTVHETPWPDENAPLPEVARPLRLSEMTESQERDIAEFARLADEVRFMSLEATRGERRRAAVIAARGEWPTTIEAIASLYDDQVLSEMRTGASQRRSLAPIFLALAEVKCSDLNEDDIEPLIEGIAARAPVHANRTLAYFSAFCRWARERGYIDLNPTRWIRRPIEERRRTRTLSLTELVDIWRAADELAHPFGEAIQLLMLTAARREDVAGMRRADLARTASSQPVWLVHERTHRERRAFEIWLSDRAQALIRKVAAQAPKGSDLVFTTTGTTGISGWSKAKRRLDEIIAAKRSAEGGMPAWRLNDFRRSFIELSAERLGGDRETLLACTGRVSHFSTELAKEWLRTPHMIMLRAEAMFRWSALLESAVAAAEPRASVRSQPDQANDRPAH
jgi:integrase